MTPQKILLIDDHALFREGLAHIIRSSFRTAELAEAASLEEVLRSHWPRPDLILLDIRLRGLSGLEGIELLRQRWPAVRILMLSSDTTRTIARQAQQRGALGLISKADRSETIVAAIRSAFADAPASEDSIPANGDQRVRLTTRQCEVLLLLDQGLSNKAIGRRIGLSENTIRGHVQGLLSTLNVASRQEAVYAARQRGWIE